MARVYVSSTYRDLKECREQVRLALRNLGHEDIAMEYYVAEDRRPLDKCLEDVSSCDLYVGVFAWRYGYIPPGKDKSITELEFRKAVEENKKCLIFLLKEGANWPTDQIEFEAIQKMQAFRNELSEKYLAGFFTGKDDIQARVMEAVIKCLSQGQPKSPPPVLPPFQAPPLPAYYIERAAAVGDVISGLLKHEQEQTGILVVSALHGLAGVGKTALAAAVAHNPIVREHFKDGVLWTTLGQEPDCLSNLVSWIYALGDKDYRPTTTVAAASYLRTLLYPTAFLLVVDDVWESEHAKPFLAGGPSCRLLITTRRANVADDLGASLCPLDAMTGEEAVALLKKRVELGRGKNLLSDQELEYAATLAREVGYLPLALELMGALVARGYDWAEVRKLLSLEYARDSETAGRRHHAQAKLEASLRVSLNTLRAEDKEAWRCFAWLGVLPDDVIINPKMAAILWSVPNDEVTRLLNFMADEAILQRSASRFSIHDLMHEMARQLLISPVPEGLGLNMRQAHIQILSRYAGQIPEGRWDQLQDDEYIYSHLLWHLEQSGDVQAIWNILQLSDAEGRNAWYVARERLEQSAGYMEDIAIARRIGYEERHFALARQCLFALVVSSMHSLAQAISPEVLLILVQRRIWTPEKALDCIRQMLGARRRAAALTGLFTILDDLGPASQNLRNTILSETRNVVRNGVDPNWGAQILVSLAQHFSGNLQAELIREAASLVAASLESLKSLANMVPSEHRDSVLEVACNLCQQIPDLAQRALSMARVVSSLSEGARLKWVELLQTWTEELGENERRTNIAAEEMTHLENAQAGWAPPHSSSQLAISADWSSRDEECQPTKDEYGPFVKVLIYCAENGIEFSNDWVSKIVKKIPHKATQSAILSQFYRKISPEQETEQFQSDPVRDFRNALEKRDINLAIELIPSLPGPHNEFVRELLEDCQWLDVERHGEIFTRLTPYLSLDYQRQLAKDLIVGGHTSIGAKCVLAVTEDEPTRSELFESAVKSLDALPGVYYRELAMLAIARTCPASFVRRALISYQRIDDVDDQAGMIFTLAPYLDGALPSDLFDHLSDTRHGRQIITLTRMVSQLSSALKSGVLEEFIKDAAHLSSEWWIVEALTLTILRLDNREQFSSILQAVGHLTLPDLRSRIVGRIVLRLSRLGCVKDALSAVNAAPDRDRWGILADLSSELAIDGRFLEAEEVAANIGSSEERSRARATIALHLAAHGRLEEARAIVPTLSVKHWMEWVQSCLDMLEGASVVPLLPERRLSHEVSPTRRIAAIDFESVCEVADLLLQQGIKSSELVEVVAAAKVGNAEGVTRAARQFWRAKVDGRKTYLDMISEKPRRLYLGELRNLGPLLNLSLRECEAEELISAIQHVSSWWP